MLPRGCTQLRIVQINADYFMARISIQAFGRQQHCYTGEFHPYNIITSDGLLYQQLTNFAPLK